MPYKRKNIEERGYDTHAGIAQAEHKKAAGAKKKDDNSEQVVQQEEQPNENAHEMPHLHPDIEEIEGNLPGHDEPKEIIKNIKVVAPKPIIKYNNDGFRPYAKNVRPFQITSRKS